MGIPYEVVAMASLAMGLSDLHASIIPPRARTNKFVHATLALAAPWVDTSPVGATLKLALSVSSYAAKHAAAGLRGCVRSPWLGCHGQTRWSMADHIGSLVPGRHAQTSLSVAPSGPLAGIRPMLLRHSLSLSAHRTLSRRSGMLPLDSATAMPYHCGG